MKKFIYRISFTNRLSGNIYLVMVYRFLLVMLLLTLSRIGFYLFNRSMFPGMNTGEFLSALRGGIVFDLSAFVYFNILVVILLIPPFDFRYNKIYSTVFKYVFFVSNGLLLAINGADYVYFRFLNKRATADVFSTFENEQHLGKMFFKFLLDYWPATLFTLFLLFLMIYLYGRVKTRKPDPANRYAHYGINILMIPLVIVLFIGAARGGYKHSTRPITISNAARYVKDPQFVPVVLNTPFSLLRTFGKKELVRYNFFPEDELKTLFDPCYDPHPVAPFSYTNVVIIIMESFAREYIGAYNKDLEGGTYKGYTPFLDSLIGESLTFDVTLANGNKSIDAMPSILASLPSLETPYIISHYANNRINGLPLLLKGKGYYSAFFHGAPNGSMGFDSFARMAGFDDYFGLDQYPDKDDFDGMWGVWDEPFFQFFASKLNTFREPFIASVFSISSHHPFKVPEKYEGMFPKGPVPICETVGYSDYALRQFFKSVSGEKWFDNTLFIITADHTNEKFHPEYQNLYGQYSVPVIFYRHGSELKGFRHRIAQQIDIMPSVLAYLNFDTEYIAFGNNLFDDSAESFGFNSYGTSYHLFMRDHVLSMIETNPVALFNYVEDTFQENNLINKKPEMKSALERKLKAVMQTYNSRMLDNNLTVEK